MILPADEKEGREELNEEGAGWVMGDLVGLDNGDGDDVEGPRARMGKSGNFNENDATLDDQLRE